MLKSRRKKHICYFIIFFLLITGIWFGNNETNVFISDAQNMNPAATITTTEQIEKTQEACTQEMLGRQKSVSSIKETKTVSCKGIGKLASVLPVSESALQHLLTNQMTVENSFVSKTFSNTVIIHYIHQKDGKKNE